MKRTLLVGSALLSAFFAVFYVGYVIYLLVSDFTEATPWAFMAMAVMFPTFIAMVIGMVFNLLYNAKQKNTYLLISAILYTIGCIVLPQIFYFTLLQAIITWSYFFISRNQSVHT